MFLQKGRFLKVIPESDVKRYRIVGRGGQGLVWGAYLINYGYNIPAIQKCPFSSTRDDVEATLEEIRMIWFVDIYYFFYVTRQLEHICYVYCIKKKL